MENTVKPYALVFNFGTNGEAGRITVRFDTEIGIEYVTAEILRLFQLRANLRNIDGVVRKSGMLPMHRRFTMSFFCMGKDISSSIQGQTFSPKCLTSTVNKIVESVFEYTQAEKNTEIEMLMGQSVLN